MSLVVTVFLPTGIVMSGDSRTTVSTSTSAPDPQSSTRTIITQTSLVLSDAANKIFQVHGRFGVGTVGDATINDLPVAHYVEEFETASQGTVPASTQACANGLLAHFRTLTPIPNTSFHVAGYDANQPWLIDVNVSRNTATRKNINIIGALEYGVMRSGDDSISSRLLSQNLPLFNLMNIQDGVDFSRHLIRATIDQMRFEPRFSTVGGPIDTLLVQNAGVKFLHKKELKCIN